MGLDFGGSLFPQQGLLQEDGLLSERWQQEGSKLINDVNQTVDADEVSYTVTTGKVAYIKQVIITLGAAHAGEQGVILCDNVIPNSTNKKAVIGVTGVVTDVIVVNYITPLKFLTGIATIENGVIDIEICFYGWEEDA